ncbi:MAG: hypothetical protein PHQ36_10600, partial [Anaerolineales bacterium]|nr:hypothetical protein [Anaerolineales bacterium]
MTESKKPKTAKKPIKKPSERTVKRAAKPKAKKNSAPKIPSNSRKIALENTRLVEEAQRLLKAERQRAAELAAINMIQEKLAAKLEFNEMINLVGDKISEIFQTQEMSIRLIDHKANMVYFPYMIDQGKRLYEDPMPLGVGFTGNIVRTRQPLVINRNLQEYTDALGSFTIGDEPVPSLAFLGAPII